jgi:hypothetical protein
MKRGRTSNPELQHAFKRIRRTAQSDMASCHNCTWTGVWHTNQLKNHILKNCLKDCQKENSQLTLNSLISITKALSKEALQEFKASIAFSCYFDNLLFNAFQPSKALRDSFLTLNPFLKFPIREEISTTLLDNQY